MDVVKKHLFLIVSAILAVVMAAVGGYFIYITQQDVAKWRTKVNEMQEALKQFRAEQYSLTPQNVEQAEANHKIAEQKFGELIETLTKFSVPEDETRAELTPVRAKSQIKDICTQMENQLRGEEIAIPAGLSSFTFGEYMRPSVMPTSEEIPMLFKHIEIVQELIYLVAQASPKRLDAFARGGDELALVKRDFYSYISFNVTMTGSPESIRRFMQSLPNSRYVFLIRSLTTSGEAGTADSAAETSGDVAGDVAGDGGGKTKAARLVYSRSPTVKAVFSLDYVEFHTKEK